MYFRVQREYLIQEISWKSAWCFLARPWEIIFYFSIPSRNMRLKKEIFALVSKHQIERKKFSFSSQKNRLVFKFFNGISCIILRKIWKSKALFIWKNHSSSKQRIRFSRIRARIVFILILVFVSKSEIEDNEYLSRLDAWDQGEFFSFSSRSLRLSARNSRPRGPCLPTCLLVFSIFCI